MLRYAVCRRETGRVDRKRRCIKNNHGKQRGIHVPVHQLDSSPGTKSAVCSKCHVAPYCLPRGLSPDDMALFDGLLGAPPPLERGEHLFRQDQKLKSLYVLRSGSLKSYTASNDGAEQVIGFYFPGDVMGLDGLEHHNHTSSAVALETSSVCELPVDELESLSQRIPALQEHLLQTAGHEIAEEHDLLLLLGQRGAEERLICFLLNLARRFGMLGRSRTDFNLSMTRYDIANFLGLAAETVSRVFTAFERAGLLTVDRRHVQLHNLKQLCKMADFCSACPNGFALQGKESSSD